MPDNTEDKNQDPIYPVPLKDRLKADAGTMPGPKRKRSIFSMRDFEPATLLTFLAVGAVVFGIIGTVVYYVTYQRANEVSPQRVAIAVANELKEHNPADPYDVMKSDIETEFKDCKTTPVLTITHHYEGPNGHPEIKTSTIDLQELDISKALEQVVASSDTATRNDLDIYCPT